MSFWISTKRVARYGFIGAIRNGFVSLAAIFIMAITLFVIAWIFIGGAALSSVLTMFEGQVDVTVYFTPIATVDEISQVQQQLAALPQVASTSLMSSDQALAVFQARHEGDQLTMQALQELGNNPLGAQLEVRAKDASQYATIAKFMQDYQTNTTGGGGIDKVNYQQNKIAIQRLSGIIAASRTLGLAISAILAVLSLLIVFNTIRLAIYTAREEIGVMNIVGASSWFVRGPFMVSGVMYGAIAGVIVLGILYPLTLSFGSQSQEFFGSFNVFSYFTSNFPFFTLLLLGSGVVLGALSSLLAVHRYLKM